MTGKTGMRWMTLLCALLLTTGVFAFFSCGDDDDDNDGEDTGDEDSNDYCGDPALGECCRESDLCNWAGDGYCDCEGACAWDASDCASDEDDTTQVCDCEIAGGCQKDGETNPENNCEFCAPGFSTTEWSDNDGVPCDDGDFCNGNDTCSGGSCSQHEGDPCTDDGDFCNGDEFCNDETQTCDHTGDPCDTDYQYCLETNDICVSEGFNFIPKGTFVMGSPSDEPGRSTNETQHNVTLTKDFEMKVMEVTQGEYIAVMQNWNPSYFPACGFDCPVECVSWYDAVAYANELSADAGYDACYTLSNVVCQDGTSVGANYMGCMNATQRGITSATVALNGVLSVYACGGYRLPTESEWEYAARAGTLTAYHNGLDSAAGHLLCEVPFHLEEIAWYCGNHNQSTRAVGQKDDNAWGLCDMSGNVSEWVWDWLGTYPGGDVIDPEGPVSGTYRVSRGGNWGYFAYYCRSAYRGGGSSGLADNVHGFRLARTLP